jgi:hypothetical protein
MINWPCQAGTPCSQIALHGYAQHCRSEVMKKLATILAASVIAGAAYAQTTVIEKKETVSPDSTTIVKERSDPDVVVKKKEMTTGSVGCESKTVQKTDSFGDTMVKQKTEC